ncbi:MAG: hydroxymethylbilane synthase [Planctomycetota bacterium]
MTDHQTITLCSDERAAATGRRTYLPLGIDVCGLRCLVVGGGRVAARKALTLARNGGRVTVLSPDVCAALKEAIAAGDVRWKQASYAPAELEGYRLVVAATSDPTLNIRIGREAEQDHALPCVVSPGRFSRVIFPAIHTGGGVTVAVHSNGRDCAESRRVRDEIARVLGARRPAAAELAVLGVKRPDVPEDVFTALTKRAPEALRHGVDASELLVLATCQRWECYFAAPSPASLARDLRRIVHEGCAVLLESYGGALYRKSGAAAYHHLLRIALGLDSPLCGETDVVGQVRDAVERWLPDDASLLKSTFGSVLRAQRSARRESGLGVRRTEWPEATVGLLESRIGRLSSRRVLLFGCGRLNERIARRLLAQGAGVVPFSQRSATTGVAWCSELGLSAHRPRDLGAWLAGSDAIVLGSRLSEGLERLVRKRMRDGEFAMVDLVGSHRSLSVGGRAGGYVAWDDVGRVPISGHDAASIALAERLALQHALRWHASRNPAPSGLLRLAVGGRGSRLSRVQLGEVADLLSLLVPDAAIDTIVMTVPCDRDKSTPLAQVRADDFFTRDLDAALLARRIDLAVHSAKDLPARIPDGLCVAAVTPSLAPWECLVTRDGQSLSQLDACARVGTSSERRRQRLSMLRPDLVSCDVRGNVPERMRQLDDGKYDALVLAAVGLIRLGLEERITQVFSVDEFPPAPGQGQLALVVREDAEQLRRLLEPLDLGDEEGLPWA